MNTTLFHILPKESLLQKREKKAWIEGQRKSNQVLSPPSSALVLSIAIRQPASQPAFPLLPSPPFQHSRNHKGHPHITSMQLTKPPQQRPIFSPTTISQAHSPSQQSHTFGPENGRECANGMTGGNHKRPTLAFSHLRRQGQAGRKWREVESGGLGAVVAAGPAGGLT